MPEMNVLLFLTLALAGFITVYLYQADEHIIDGQDPASQSLDLHAANVRSPGRRSATVDQPMIRGLAAAFFDLPETHDQRGKERGGLELDFIAGLCSDLSAEADSSCDRCA